MRNVFQTAPEMDGSSWRQIRENMRRIKEISDLLGEKDIPPILEANELPDVAALLAEMLELLNDLASRIGTITALVENINNNLQPTDYNYDITYEFKDPKAIGLGNSRGFIGLTHCLLQTVVTSSIEGDTNFKPYQIALGEDMAQYYRYATTTSNGTVIWGPWKRIRYGTGWLVKDVAPEDDEQEIGDFWLLPDS